MMLRRKIYGREQRKPLRVAVTGEDADSFGMSSALITGQQKGGSALFNHSIESQPSPVVAKSPSKLRPRSEENEEQDKLRDEDNIQ